MKKMNKLKVLSKACMAIAVILIAGVIILCAPLTVPKLMNYSMYSVVSGSMAPAIPVGSMVYVQNASVAELQPGEIVVFYEEQGSNAIVTHRVVENNVAGGVLTTKGDANEQNDPRPVTYDRYIGKVVRYIPYMGFISGILTDLTGKIGIACLIFFAVVLYLVGEMLGGKGAKKKKKRRIEDLVVFDESDLAVGSGEAAKPEKNAELERLVGPEKPAEPKKSAKPERPKKPRAPRVPMVPKAPRAPKKPEKSEDLENPQVKRKGMTDKQFRSLNRRELIEIIYYVETKMDMLQSENASLKQELNELRKMNGIEEQKQSEEREDGAS